MSRVLLVRDPALRALAIPTPLVEEVRARPPCTPLPGADPDTCGAAWIRDRIRIVRRAPAAWRRDTAAEDPWFASVQPHDLVVVTRDDLVCLSVRAAVEIVEVGDLPDGAITLRAADLDPLAAP